MNYSLGNTLSRAGSLNPDGLALDLAFALDKTLTARKGPTPAFTRSSTATFVGSNGLIQSAAINGPRFDHDPVTGLCKGLLIEDTRTNLVFPSETLTTQTRTVAAVAHTLSFYGTGTVVLSGVHSATVVGTGVFPARTTLTFTPTAGSLTLTVTGTVQFAQVEAGAFPTSYIPTTIGTAARSADVCSIIGDAFSSFYNQTEGTLFGDVTPQTVDQLAVVVGVNTTTFQNSHLLYKINSTALAAGKRWVANTNVAGPAQSSLIPTPTDIAVSRGILSYAYKLNDMAFAANGTLIGTDNTGTMPFPAAMRIGGRDDGLQINGHIARIQYFRKRLSNAKLQTLTAP